MKKTNVKLAKKISYDAMVRSQQLGGFLAANGEEEE
jgi:hypothetical protein